MIILLDIDGVMVHANPVKKVEMENDGFYRFSTPAVEALNFLMNKNDCEVMLTTSHRFRYSIAEWKNIFLNRGIDIKKISRIENETPFGETRKESVLKWITLHNLMPEEILIIDDDKSLNGLPENLKHRLVLTAPYKGLCTSDLIF